MFGSMVTRLATCSSRSQGPIICSVACFHRSVVLNKGRPSKYGQKSNCPDTEETTCRPLMKRHCNPMDPPVRPCSEQDCIPRSRYPCCVNTRISQNSCEKSGKKADFKKKRDPFVSMWESTRNDSKRTHYLWDYPAECCPPCDDVRFDVLYYRPSDKCRKYQRTWWECCPSMVPKRICCWCDAVPPQVLRRCLPLCPRSACNDDHEKDRMKCLNKKYKNCMRLRMPCCRAARIPPSCVIQPGPSECEKIKCPFPSFSECISEELATPPERPGECRCLGTMSNCERDRYADRLRKYDIKLNSCTRRCS